VIVHQDAVALALARLRRNGWLPPVGLPLAEAEERARQSGRQIVLVSGDNDPPLAVLGWQGAEPAANPHPPRLARRALSPRATKTLVIVYALLTDPQASLDMVTTEQVLAAIELLTSRSGQTWAIPALQQELPQVGLMAPQSTGWAPGPMMQAWDPSTRDVMAHAARQLREHPMWSGIRDA
jgi:hypothetical protein